MNPGDKISLKAQLQAIGAQIQATGQLGISGAGMPIITPMGPAASPGLVQVGAALGQQAAQTLELLKVIAKIVDNL
jgi:hypothetical protein